MCFLVYAGSLSRSRLRDSSQTPTIILRTARSAFGCCGAAQKGVGNLTPKRVDEADIAVWNPWAKRFNAMLSKAFGSQTFPDFLEEAVRKMYRDGWKPEDAANGFIWGIRQVGCYLPVDVSPKTDETDAKAR